MLRSVLVLSLLLLAGGASATPSLWVGALEGDRDAFGAGTYVWRDTSPLLEDDAEVPLPASTLGSSMGIVRILHNVTAPYITDGHVTFGVTTRCTGTTVTHPQGASVIGQLFVGTRVFTATAALDLLCQGTDTHTLAFPIGPWRFAPGDDWWLDLQLRATNAPPAQTNIYLVTAGAAASTLGLPAWNGSLFAPAHQTIHWDNTTTENGTGSLRWFTDAQSALLRLEGTMAGGRLRIDVRDLESGRTVAGLDIDHGPPPPGALGGPTISDQPVVDIGRTLALPAGNGTRWELTWAMTAATDQGNGSITVSLLPVEEDAQADGTTFRTAAEPPVQAPVAANATNGTAPASSKDTPAPVALPAILAAGAILLWVPRRRL